VETKDNFISMWVNALSQSQHVPLLRLVYVVGYGEGGDNERGQHLARIEAHLVCVIRHSLVTATKHTLYIAVVNIHVHQS